MQRFSAIPSRAISDDRISDSEYRTLGAIAAHSDKDGWCYPSQGKLAEIRGLSRQTISKHVKKLKKLGYILVEHRFREDGGQTSNMIQVRLDWPKLDRGCKAQEFTGGVKPEVYTNTTEGTLQKKDLLSPNGDGPYDDQQDTNSEAKQNDFPFVENKESTKETANNSGQLNKNEARGLLEDYFIDLTGLPSPPRKTSREKKMAGVRWWRPLDRIYEVSGEDVAKAKRLMKDVVRRMREDRLTIAAPQSIEQNVIARVGEENSSKPMSVW